MMDIRAFFKGATSRVSLIVTAALAYLPLLFSEPGRVAADTKQYLYLDPARLMERAPYMWDSHIGLGTVTHQNIGYLFPMGPYYWLMDRIGMPDWIAQRLWLGSIMFFAALGVRYLMRTLGAPEFAAAIAGLVYMLSPYSLDYAARISVILLPWAALGWMLGLTIRASVLQRWREPALFALVVQIVGGVNATALIFAGLAPLLWLVFAALLRQLPWKNALRATARIGVMSITASLWWVAGLSLQGGYGIDILRFTETVRTVSGASMSGEVLRGLGYWFFYGTDKVGPWIEASSNYTQRPWLIAIGYFIPAAALCAAVLVRWKYRRYFISLMVLGMAIAVGTHPYDDPAPFGALLKGFAQASSAGLALRSTGRAVPLVSLGIAVFFGIGAHALRDRLRQRTGAIMPRLGASIGALATVLAVAGFSPIWDRQYYASSLLRDEEIPTYWNEAIAAADAGDHRTRIFEIPGSDFATYRWGGLVDPVTPGRTDRPYLARELIPWGSPASADLVNAFDRQLQEGVLEPEAIIPMAQLLGAGTLLLRNDLQTDRYNLVRPSAVAKLLQQAGLSPTQQFGFGRMVSLHFPLLDERTLNSAGSEATQIPAVALYTVPSPPRILGVVSANQPVILEGDGEGVVAAASSGLISPDRVLLEAGSFVGDDAQLQRNAARPGAHLVVTDTNRKRARRWSTVRENTGMTERADQTPLTDDASDARLDLFPGSTSASQTVAVTRGGEVDATGYGNPVSYTAENRPTLAFDGDTSTAWKVGDFSDVAGEFIRLRLPESTTIDHIELVQPLTGPRDRYITSATLTLDSQSVPLVLDDRSRTEGGQNIPLPTPIRARTLEIHVEGTNVGTRADYGGVSGVGFSEIRVFLKGESEPVRVSETIRLPTHMLSVLGERSADTQLTYVFDRVRTDGYPPRSDEERSLKREFVVPTQRAFALGGVVRLNGNSLALDRLLTQPNAESVTVQASSALGGAARARPYAAIDGSASTMWQPAFGDVEHPWVELQRQAPESLGSFELRFAHDAQHSVVKEITATWEGGSTTAQTTRGTGTDHTVDIATLRIPRDVMASSIRFTVTALTPRSTLEYFSNAQVTLPIGLSEISSSNTWVTAQPIRQLDSECRSDLISIDGTPIAVRLDGALEKMVEGGRASVRNCEPLSLEPGTHQLSAASGLDSALNIDHVVLSSSADASPAAIGEYGVLPDSSAGETSSPSTVTVGKVSASLDLKPSAQDRWVVLRESFNAGWEGSGVVKGSSTLVNGFANGWLVPANTQGTANLEWTPQRRVWWALGLSGIACLVALAFASNRVGSLRRRRFDPAIFDADWVESPSPSPATASAPARSAVIILSGAVIASFLAGLAVGVIAFALGVLMWRVPRRARVVATLGSVCAVLVGAYIIIQQIRYAYPPQFEWPTRFDRMQHVGWLAVIIPALYLWLAPSLSEE